MLLAPMLAALALAAAAPCAIAQAKADSKTKARDAAIDAQIRSYRCAGKDGRKYYGAIIPPQCAGQMIEALSGQGMVLRRIEAPLTPEQRAAQEVEAQKSAAVEQARRDAQAAARVQARRDQALLQTYASEKDIDLVRQRALADNRTAAAQVEARIAQLKQRQDQLGKEAAKYKDGATPPHKFEQDVRAVAYDLSLQEQLLESRRNEATGINARYDEEIRKYRQLTGAAKN